MDCFPGVDPALQKESRTQMPVPSATPTSAASSSSSSKFHRARSGGARDERYRSGKSRDKGSPRIPVNEEECTLSSQGIKLIICPLMESPTLVVLYKEPSDL